MSNYYKIKQTLGTKYTTTKSLYRILKNIDGSFAQLKNTDFLKSFSSRNNVVSTLIEGKDAFFDVSVNVKLIQKRFIKLLMVIIPYLHSLHLFSIKCILLH